MNKDLLDLKSDWVFKRVFGKEGNEDILADLLSAILKIEIKKVELRNTELTKDSEEQKLSILDIKAILNDNSIAHLKFEPYEEETYIKLYDKEETTLTDKLEIHIIELQKFLKAKKLKDTKLTQWLMLLTGEREMMEMALSKKAEKIKKAYEELEYLSQDQQARDEFDEYMQAKINEKRKMDYATKNKAIEIAKKMLKADVSIKEIANYTDLSEEEIQLISKSI